MESNSVITDFKTGGGLKRKLEMLSRHDQDEDKDDDMMIMMNNNDNDRPNETVIGDESINVYSTVKPNDRSALVEDGQDNDDDEDEVGCLEDDEDLMSQDGDEHQVADDIATNANSLIEHQASLQRASLEKFYQQQLLAAAAAAVQQQQQLQQHQQQQQQQPVQHIQQQQQQQQQLDSIEANKGYTFEEQFKQLYELSDDPKRKEFLDDLFQFMADRNQPVNRIPIMAKQVLDLYELYNLVVERGGLVEVINKKIWREITKGLSLPSSITSAAFTLRTQYMKYLYPYECAKRGFSRQEELQQAIDGNRREGRRSGAAGLAANYNYLTSNASGGNLQGSNGDDRHASGTYSSSPSPTGHLFSGSANGGQQQQQQAPSLNHLSLANLGQQIPNGHHHLFAAAAAAAAANNAANLGPNSTQQQLAAAAAAALQLHQQHQQSQNSPDAARQALSHSSRRHQNNNNTNHNSQHIRHANSGTNNQPFSNQQRSSAKLEQQQLFYQDSIESDREDDEDQGDDDGRSIDLGQSPKRRDSPASEQHQLSRNQQQHNNNNNNSINNFQLPPNDPQQLAAAAAALRQQLGAAFGNFAGAQNLFNQFNAIASGARDSSSNNGNAPANNGTPITSVNNSAQSNTTTTTSTTQLRPTTATTTTTTTTTTPPPSSLQPPRPLSHSITPQANGTAPMATNNLTSSSSANILFSTNTTTSNASSSSSSSSSTTTTTATTTTNSNSPNPFASLLAASAPNGGLNLNQTSISEPVAKQQEQLLAALMAAATANNYNQHQQPIQQQPQQHPNANIMSDHQTQTNATRAALSAMGTNAMLIPASGAPDAMALAQAAQAAGGVKGAFVILLL